MTISFSHIDFDFNSLEDPDGIYPTQYKEIIKGTRDPVFIFFPFIERHLGFLFKKSGRTKRLISEFYDMINEIVVHKRHVLEHSNVNENLDENEKDLLTLMIEAELQGEGALSNDELMVRNIFTYFKPSVYQVC